MKTWRSGSVLTVAVALAVAACGGGGGSGSSVPSVSQPPQTTTPPGSAKTYIVSGAISGFGSVIVNGVRYDTSATTVRIEDRIGTVSELRVGEVVRMEAEEDGRGGRRARSIEMRRLLQGAVESVDASRGTMTVAGQSVIVDDDTSFDDSFAEHSIGAIGVGERVEVHGFLGSDGQARATRLDRASPGDGEIEVKGMLGGLDAVARRFVIGDLRVDYSAASLERFGAEGPREGDLVEVKGREYLADGTLRATRVEREGDRFDGGDNTEVEVEGLITRFGSSEDFDVAGKKVRTNAGTSFVHGDAGMLGFNARVEVEGRLDATGLLIANRVQFKHRTTVRFSARVDGVDPEANTFRALGLVVVVDSITRREDREGGRREFGVADLRVGDWVEAAGHADPAGSGRIVATRLEREDPEDEVELRGPASELAAPLLRIASVPVETTVATRFEEDDVDMAAATFFSVATGRVVEAEGDWNGTRLVATKIEIEDRYDDGPLPPPTNPPVSNRSPVANAGSPQSVTIGSPVNLDGSASSDPDGDPLGFSWILQAPSGSSAALTASDTSQPSFIADVAGVYVASLTVSDGQASATSSVNVTARDPAVNQAPAAVATASVTSAVVGETISFSSAGSSDPEGQPLSYSWSLQGPAGSVANLSSASAAAPTLTPDAPGDYVATLRVSDGQLQSAPATVAVGVSTAAAGPDGARLYADNCAGCHGAIDAIRMMSPGRRSASNIQDAIDRDRGGMRFLSRLTAAEVQAIAEAIAAANP
jgi:mono/diheme cytochrome c family protein